MCRPLAHNNYSAPSLKYSTGTEPGTVPVRMYSTVRTVIIHGGSEAVPGYLPVGVRVPGGM